MNFDPPPRMQGLHDFRFEMIIITHNMAVVIYNIIYITRSAYLPIFYAFVCNAVCTTLCTKGWMLYVGSGGTSVFQIDRYFEYRYTNDYIRINTPRSTMLSCAILLLSLNILHLYVYIFTRDSAVCYL